MSNCLESLSQPVKPLPRLEGEGGVAAAADYNTARQAERCPPDEVGRFLNLVATTSLVRPIEEDVGALSSNGDVGQEHFQEEGIGTVKRRHTVVGGGNSNVLCGRGVAHGAEQA